MNPTRKIILLSLVFGAVILLLIVFIIYPLFERIQSFSRELISTKKELVLSEEAIGKSEQFKETYQKIKSGLTKIDQFFVNPEVPVDLIEFWEKTAENTNLSIEISPVSLRAGEKEEIWNSIIFRINVEGSFSDILKFLQKIETGPYLTEVQNITAKEDFVNLTIKVFTQ